MGAVPGGSAVVMVKVKVTQIETVVGVVGDFDDFTKAFVIAWLTIGGHTRAREALESDGNGGIDCPCR